MRLRAQASGSFGVECGYRIIEALDRVAGRTGADNATVALAWLLTQPTVTATIASARVPSQLPRCLRAVISR
jgi:aryl-alcohol dehydrogenase-like predicted oxidoreductase